MTEKRRIHDTAAITERLAEITRRARLDLRFLHDDRTRAHIAAELADATDILDVGAGMRGALDGHPGRVESLDINDFGDYPDILGDICSPLPAWMEARYDAAIALAVLEHVYDPPAAVANLRHVLRPGGRLFLYVPWIWRYHGPPDLAFQDYQRFSRDGLAYLLRDFEGVTLYPIRGKYAAIANLLKLWKRHVERRVGGRINRLLDARASDWRNTVQASGFLAEARVPGQY
ncbi:MAG: methyltransferase domain-containing protein [Pseudomonadota bacterium]